MTVYPELDGITLISNATDREGDPITVYRINGSIITWAGLESVAIVAGELTAYVAQNGTVTVEPTDNTNSPANATTTLFGSFTYTLWDGQGEGATRTCNISLKGAATPGGSSPYVLTGLLMELDPDAGVTGSTPVTAWTDQIGSKAFTAVGSPTLGTPPGGTATNTMDLTGTDTSFNSTDLTDFPTSGSDRTVMMIWKPIGGFGYAGFGWGSAVFGQAFTLSIDDAGQLAFDYYGERIGLGITPTGQWNIVTARLSNGTLTVYVGAAKAYSAAISLATGTDAINVCQTFSNKVVDAEVGDIIVYGRALTDAEIIANVAVANGRFIGDTAVTAPGTPAGSSVAAASFTVGGTVGESYGNVLWAVKAGTGAMTEQEIIDGTGALAYGVKPIDNAATWSADVTGATASTVYRCHAVFYDLVGGKSSVVTSADITTAGTDSTAPVLSSAAGTSGTSSTTATVSVTTDEGNGNAVWGLYLASATVPNRAQLRAGTDGDGAALVATGTVNPVTASGGLAGAASGLTPNTSYQVAWQHDDAAGNQSSVAESAAWSTAAAATTTPEQVDGLHNGSTPVGRTSVNALKTVGQLPAGASLGTGVITLTSDDVTLADFDLTGHAINFNNRTNIRITQSLLDVTGAAKIASHFVVIGVGSTGFRLDYNDINGGIGDRGDKSLIQQLKSSTGAGATCAGGGLIQFNKLYNFTNDGIHLVGNGVICEWNWFGLPNGMPNDLTFYSGTPGDYTTGDCVAWERFTGQWYPRRCISASPTLHPTQADNADWVKPLPHTDYINTRASIGSGTTVRNCYFHDNWVQDMLDGLGVRVANVNNALRIQRNIGDTAPFNLLTMSGLKNDRNRNTPTAPYQLVVGGANFAGPVNVSDMRIGRSTPGAYWLDGAGQIGTWSNVVDAWSGAALAQP